MRECDHPRGGHTGEVHRFRLIAPEGTYTADLCEKHARPVCEVFEVVKTTSGGKRRRKPVVSKEEQAKRLPPELR